MRYIAQQKFPGKVLMWLCISENGMSKSKFFKSGLGIKGNTYSTQCFHEVKKFIQKYIIRLFVLEKLRLLGLMFVSKDENPPNVPQMRPIED